MDPPGGTRATMARLAPAARQRAERPRSPGVRAAIMVGDVRDDV